MSTAVLGSIRFSRASADRASFEATLDQGCACAFAAQEVARVFPRTRGVVVQLTPRHFTETAAHFLRVATPVEWQLDESDID